MTRQRLTRISVIGILVFTLLVAARLLYEEQWIGSLLTKESQSIPGVNSVEILKDQGIQEMIVTTENVTDLQSLSQELVKIAGTTPIRIQDQRNETLEKVYQKMQFAIYEGIELGNFREMEEILAKQAEGAGVELNLTMDDQAIYLNLTQGENQLLSVIQRQGENQFLNGKANTTEETN